MLEETTTESIVRIVTSDYVQYQTQGNGQRKNGSSGSPWAKDPRLF